ncbi:MAG TPA: DUF4382 domain-containing protein [Bacteroidia bacterium]|nr:DUF4382 domain-containing protein [Bacteroidia bacterium]
MKTMKMISIAALVALAITGCKKESIDSQTPGPAGRSFSVNMTDAPANFQRMDIEITGVDAYHDSRGWISLSSQARSINVLSLSNGITTSIAAANNVETGHYSRLRVDFSDRNSVTVHSAVTIGSLQIAAGSTSMLQWGTHSRDVEIVIDKNVSAQNGAEVLLDFDAAASVEEGVNSFVFNPTMRLMDFTTTGARGTVAGVEGAAFVVMSDHSLTYTAYANAQGQFLLRGVRPGAYTVTFTAMVRNIAGQLEERRAERKDVHVVEGSFTEMGTIQF